MKTNCFLKAIISVALCLTISFAFASCSDDGAPGAQTFVGSIDGVRILEAEDCDYTGVFAKVGRRTLTPCRRKPRSTAR